MHQTIIGLETMKQFELVDDRPDVMVACLGGGSNFGGFTLPFAGEVLQKKRECRFLAAQTEVSGNLVRGEYRYDYGDHAGKTPLLKMYTVGHQAEMEPVKADGLRYHAAAPVISYLKHLGLIEAVEYPRDEMAVFQAARTFVQTEDSCPARSRLIGWRAGLNLGWKFKGKM